MNTVVLGDVLTDAQPGFACGQQDPDGVFQFRMHNVSKSSNVDLQKRRRVPPGAHRQLERFLVKKDDVLFNATNSPENVGKSIVVPPLDEPAVFSNHFIRLRPKPERLVPSFLWRWLQWRFQRGEFRAMCRQWVNQATVSRESLLALEIFLPPVHEQHRIAAILEQAQKLTERYQTMRAVFDELIAAIFAGIVNGPDIPRQDLRGLGVDFKSGKNIIGSAQDSHPTNRVIKVSAVSSGVFDPAESKPLPQTYRPPQDHRIHKNDILFGRASGSIDLLGATAVVDQECVDLFLPDKVWRLVISPEHLTTHEFIFGVLRSSDFRSFVRHHASGAAGVRNIGKSTVLSYSAPVPCASAQQMYSDRVVAIRKQMQKASSAATIAAELFETLQSRAFSGQL